LVYEETSNRQLVNRGSSSPWLVLQDLCPLVELDAYYPTPG
jgi:hypothetical protein